MLPALHSSWEQRLERLLPLGWLGQEAGRPRT
jgi:hypothetical protein